MAYIILSAASVLMVCFAWWRSPTPSTPWLFLTAGGAVTLGDLFVNALLRMYLYMPGLLRGRFRDNYLGVLMAEWLFVPAYYTFLASLSQRYRYLIGVLGMVPVLLIEELFLRLRVYTRRTWTLWHTVVGFVLYSLGLQVIADGLRRRGYSGIRRLILIASATYFAMNLWGIVVVGIFRLGHYHLGLVWSRERDLVLSSLLLHAIPFTVIGIAGTWFRLTVRPAFVIFIGIGFSLWLWVLRRFGIWQGRGLWSPWLSGGLASLVLSAIGLVDRWFLVHARGPSRAAIPVP